MNVSKDKDKGIVEEKVQDQSFMLKAMQQQFEQMNLMFGEIRDKLERQDVEIANLQRGKQATTYNARKHHRHATTRDVDDGDDLDDFKDCTPIVMRDRGDRRIRRIYNDLGSITIEDPFFPR